MLIVALSCRKNTFWHAFELYIYINYTIINKQTDDAKKKDQIDREKERPNTMSNANNPGVCANPRCQFGGMASSTHRCPCCRKNIHAPCGKETDDLHFVPDPSVAHQEENFKPLWACLQICGSQDATKCQSLERMAQQMEWTPKKQHGAMPMMDAAVTLVGQAYLDWNEFKPCPAVLILALWSSTPVVGTG